MTIVPLPPRGQWFVDDRDGDPALRVSWHPEVGCVGTVRLAPADAARLIGVLADGRAPTAAPADEASTA